MLDTLEYLQKGSRIGKANAMLGNLLRIRSHIIVKNSEVHQPVKERARRKVIAKQIATAKGFTPLQQSVVMYSTSTEEAYLLLQHLSGLVDQGRTSDVAQFGPTYVPNVGPNWVPR